MGNGLRTPARRVLLQQVAPAYHQASGPQKQHILEDFVGATGYARKYARWLLNHSEEVFAPQTSLRRRYGQEVEEALVLAWKMLNRICTQRLIPFFYQTCLKPWKRRGMSSEAEEHRSQLLSMSAAISDRILQAHRYIHPHGLTRRQAGGDHLFGSKGMQPLTKNGVTKAFVRFRKQDGISATTVRPQVLRHSFALRYLHTGGNPQSLQELLCYEGMAPVRQYLRWYDQLLHEQTQQATEVI